jgi:hypothetical protein
VVCRDNSLGRLGRDELLKGLSGLTSLRELKLTSNEIQRLASSSFSLYTWPNMTKLAPYVFSADCVFIGSELAKMIKNQEFKNLTILRLESNPINTIDREVCQSSMIQQFQFNRCILLLVPLNTWLFSIIDLW